MKSILPTTVLALLMSIQAFSQSFIEPTNDVGANKVDELENRIAVVDYQPVAIDLSLLTEQTNTFEIQIFDEEVEVIQDKLNVRQIRNFSWFASNRPEITSVLLTVLEDDIQGTITIGTNIYQIVTVRGVNYVTKIDQSLYPKEACFEHGYSEEHEHNVDEIHEDDQKSTKSHQVNTGQRTHILDEPFACRLRVLVLYTPAAAAASTNVVNTARLAIDGMNQSFVNSNINREVELVYVEETAYVEQGSSTDLTRFRTPNDGFMDEVHQLRDVHQADICVLIAEETDFCGIASKVKASAPNAFCVVNRICAVGNFSLAHEIGHLIGCDHNPADRYTGSNFPYTYAFGYREPNDSWRTIMSYDCDSGSCPRLQFWSNPDVNFNSIPMGTVDNDNARMIEEKYPNAMNYRQPNLVEVVIEAHILDAIEGDVIAVDRVESNGILDVTVDQEYSFQAGEQVILKPGFRAIAGSEFYAEIVDVQECGEDDGEPGDFKSNLLTQSIINQNEVIRLSLYPNPITNDVLTVELNSQIQTELCAEIIDITGANILEQPANVNLGKSFFDLTLSELPTGAYFFRLIKDNEIVNLSKIIKQ